MTVPTLTVIGRAEQRRVKIETELEGHTEERWEVYGYTGHCLVTLEEDVAAAAAIVATAGTGALDRRAGSVIAGPFRGRRLQRASSSMSTDELEAELGELRPEPETRGDTVTVRVALVAAEGR